MSTNIGHAMHADTTSHRESFIERLAHKMRINAQSSTIFGEPVERDGVTMIPVARARWSLAGRGAPNEQRSQESLNAGGRVTVSPVGYIVLRDGKPRYQPIFDFATILPWLIGSGIVGVLVLQAVRRLSQPTRL